MPEENGAKKEHIYLLVRIVHCTKWKSIILITFCWLCGIQCSDQDGDYTAWLFHCKTNVLNYVYAWHIDQDHFFFKCMSNINLSYICCHWWCCQILVNKRCNHLIALIVEVNIDGCVKEAQLAKHVFMWAVFIRSMCICRVYSLKDSQKI